MKIILRVILALIKVLLRIPLDFILYVPLLFRKAISPKLEDSVFISDIQKLSQFSFSPGDLVIQIRHYLALTGQLSDEEINKLPYDGFVIGSVVGYNLQKGEVLVSQFNAAEVERPNVISLPERKLKLLKSPLPEVLLEVKVAQTVRQLADTQLNNDQDSDQDILSNLSNIKGTNEEDDDENNSGGGLIH